MILNGKTDKRAKHIKIVRDMLVTLSGDNYEARCADFHFDMLKQFPDAIAVHDGNHVMTVIDNKFVVDAKCIFVPFKELAPERYEQSKEWSK